VDHTAGKGGQNNIARSGVYVPALVPIGIVSIPIIVSRFPIMIVNSVPGIAHRPN
jgi:hypothetical protein